MNNLRNRKNTDDLEKGLYYYQDIDDMYLESNDEEDEGYCYKICKYFYNLLFYKNNQENKERKNYKILEKKIQDDKNLTLYINKCFDIYNMDNENINVEELYKNTNCNSYSSNSNCNSYNINSLNISNYSRNNSNNEIEKKYSIRKISSLGRFNTAGKYINTNKLKKTTSLEKIKKEINEEIKNKYKIEKYLDYEIFSFGNDDFYYYD